MRWEECYLRIWKGQVNHMCYKRDRCIINKIYFIAAEFPFISYYVINTQQTDPNSFYTGVRIKSLAKFEPKVRSLFFKLSKIDIII